MYLGLYIITSTMESIQDKKERVTRRKKETVTYNRQNRQSDVWIGKLK